VTIWDIASAERKAVWDRGERDFLSLMERATQGIWRARVTQDVVLFFWSQRNCAASYKHDNNALLWQRFSLDQQSLQSEMAMESC
jgi:hypothetical protein